MAPEIEKYGESYMGLPADIFSLGVLLFIIIFGVPPFTRAQAEDRNYKIFCRKADFFWQMQPTVKKYVAKNGPINPQLVSLLTSMFSADVSARPVNI